MHANNHDGEYPFLPTAWAGSPDTAFAAAESVAGIATDREGRALAWIREQAENGGTADETAEALGWERYSSRPRLSMLHARGAIVDSGKRRKGVSGRMQAVWVLPEHVPAPISAGGGGE